MKRKGKWIVAGVISAALIGGGTGIAVGTVGGDDDSSEKPITGSALERASAAALEHMGGGKVTDTEVGDEEGYYEVEVTLGSGKQTDVHLDKDFKVISTEADSEDEKNDKD